MRENDEFRLRAFSPGPDAQGIRGFAGFSDGSRRPGRGHPSEAYPCADRNPSPARHAAASDRLLERPGRDRSNPARYIPEDGEIDVTALCAEIETYLRPVSSASGLAPAFERTHGCHT